MYPLSKIAFYKSPLYKILRDHIQNYHRTVSKWNSQVSQQWPRILWSAEISCEMPICRIDFIDLISPAVYLLGGGACIQWAVPSYSAHHQLFTDRGRRLCLFVCYCWLDPLSFPSRPPNPFPLICTLETIVSDGNALLCQTKIKWQ